METTQPDRTTVPLALGAWLLRPRHTWALLAAVLGIPTLVLVALVFMIAADASEGPTGVVDVLAAFWAELVQDPGDRLMLGAAAVLAPLAAVLFAVQRRAYMHVTPAGLEAYIPRVLGLGLFRQSVGRWSVRWDVPFAVTGAVAVLASSQLGRGAPSRERLAVGALTVVALVAAAHPATLRLNAATAEPETVAYVSLGTGRFEPPDDRLPPIDLSTLGVPEYWARYARGAEHEFTLLRGTAGFYQLALRPVYERTRRFYSDGS